jgi:hypothetical protein
MLTTELVIGMAILVMVVLPLGYSLINDARALRANYEHSVAMEIVDGEMEILAAGQWRSVPEGTNTYAIHAAAAASLPSGQFRLTRKGNYLRLEWKADPPRFGNVMREVTVK